MEYSFDKKLATKYGLKEAVFYNQWKMIIEKLSKFDNKKNYIPPDYIKKGLYIRISCEKMKSCCFEFWSSKQIRTIVKSLKEKQLLYIVTSSDINRTNWYCLPEWK